MSVTLLCTSTPPPVDAWGKPIGKPLGGCGSALTFMRDAKGGSTIMVCPKCDATNLWPK